ncbi:hypothetical protein Pla175_42370 [Pirellulimonas nuda]|uniref:Uncharacterized protein n=1 Tax=Pirellulimonas nuda TaxID=2528009 RepID=A0A518DH79_9BACT|nr:hypothetical protein [Pirellulimonas nuda]QDU90824.1 hypothetical protein Pla175_42370 [Pirellulimonas nuda]
MIETLLVQSVGVGFVIALIAGMYKANARRWGRLASAYRVSEQLPSYSESAMQTIILVGGDFGWNSYRGITTVGVAPEGLLLKLMPPFSTFHPPLLIPYSDLSIEPKRWYLIGKSHQCTLRRVDDVRIIIDDKVLEWIKSEATSLAVETR